MNKKKSTNGVTKEFIHKRANGIEENNIQQVMDRASDIKNKVIHSEKRWLPLLPLSTSFHGVQTTRQVAKQG